VCDCSWQIGHTYLGDDYRICVDAVYCSEDELTLGSEPFNGPVKFATQSFESILRPVFNHKPGYEQCPIKCSYSTDNPWIVARFDKKSGELHVASFEEIEAFVSITCEGYFSGSKATAITSVFFKDFNPLTNTSEVSSDGTVNIGDDGSIASLAPNCAHGKNKVCKAWI
jgi:hypothetical protein